MAFNDWFSQNNKPFDPSSFNYGTEEAKLKRQRALVDAVMQQAMTPNQGQFIKHGDFIGYAGGNTVGSTLARLAAAYLGSQAQGKLDDQQAQLDKNSMSALAYQMDPNNTPWAQEAAAKTQAAENESEIQRLLARNAAQAGSYFEPQGNGEAQTTAVPTPQVEVREIPAIPKEQLAAAAAKALGRKPQAALPPALAAGAPGTGMPPASAPQVSQAEQPRPIMPVATQFPALAPQPGQAPAAAEQLPPEQQQQVAWAEQQMAKGLPVSDSRTALEKARAEAVVTMGQQIQHLAAIANTNPMGAQLAKAQLDLMFSNKNGEYKVDLNRNPETGELTVVRYNTKTGQTQILNGGGGSTNGLSKRDIENGRYQLDRDQFYNETTKNLEGVRSDKARVDTVHNLINDTIAEVEKYGAHGGVLSSVYGSVAGAFGNDAVNSLKAKLTTIGALNLKDLFGAAPSDAEGRALQAVVGSLSAGMAPTMDQLKTLRDLAAKRQSTLAQSEASYATQQQRYAPQAPAQAPSTQGQGKPPGYKQSITGPNDILSGRM